jgi:hypothetical protein
MKAKLQVLLSTIGSQLADIWNRSKMFLLAIGAVLIALEWQKIKEALLVYAGQREIKKDKVEDANLAKQESAANTQADALVKDAESLPTQEKPVDDDWNKK